MQFTFGIITNATDGLNPLLVQSIESIKKLNIPEYEIVVVGGGGSNLDPIRNDARIIDFNENIKPAWITKKKNIITREAKYENVVYAHDYIHFDDNWYEGFLKYGDDWDLVMTRILNVDGSRFRDWTIFPHGRFVDKARIYSGFEGHECLLPFDEHGFSKLQYFSGSYFLAKKSIMTSYPLDERLCWSEGEDVSWSEKVREKHNFSMNVHSSVTLLKYKDRAFYEMRPEVHEKMKEFLIKEGKYG